MRNVMIEFYCILSVFTPWQAEVFKNLMVSLVWDLEFVGVYILTKGCII